MKAVASPISQRSNNGVLATPSVMEDSTDSVSPGVTIASSASTPERQHVVVTRKRLRKMTVPNVEAAFDENESEDINLAFGLKVAIPAQNRKSSST